MLPAKPECPRRFLLNSAVETCSSPIFSLALPTFATNIFSRRHFHTNTCRMSILRITLGKKIAFFRLPELFCGPKICQKCASGWGPGPRWGAHDVPPDQLVGWGGNTPPQTSPHSAPSGASILAPLTVTTRRRIDPRAPPEPGASPLV